MIAGITGFDSLMQIKITSESPNQWTVPATGLASGDTLVVFDKNRTHVALAVFVPVASSENGNLNFLGTDALAGFEIPENKIVGGLKNPTTTLIAKNGFAGRIARVGAADQRQFHLEPQGDSTPLSEAGHFYKGQLLLALDSSQKPSHARLIEDYRAHDQTLTLNADIDLNGKPPVLILAGVTPPSRTPVARVESGIPTLFRHERLVSLPELPYYRKYKVSIAPRFDGTEISDKSTSDTESETSDTSYAQRKPSVLSLFKPQLTAIVESEEVIAYSFRLFLSCQGDLLTPKEIQTDLGMVDPDKTAVLSGIRHLSAAELPDLNCTYQILWELPDSTDAEPVYAELVELLLPGSPQYSGDPVPANPILIQNRNGDKVKVVDKTAIKLWWPSQDARPVYVVMFDVKVTVSEGENPTPAAIFRNPLDTKNPGLPWLQMQRDGYRTRPVKFKIFDTQSQ